MPPLFRPKPTAISTVQPCDRWLTNGQVSDQSPLIFAEKKPSPFGTLSILPPELRTRVYQYAIASGSPNIVATSRAINNEVGPVNQIKVLELEFNVFKRLDIYPDQRTADKIQHLHIRLNLKDPRHTSSALTYVEMNPWLKLISSWECKYDFSQLLPTKSFEQHRKSCHIVFDCHTLTARYTTCFDVIATLRGFEKLIIEIADDAPEQTEQQLRDRKHLRQPDPNFSFEPVERCLPGWEVWLAYDFAKRVCNHGWDRRY